jgi:protease-4
MYEDQIRQLVRSRMHVKDSTDYPEVSLGDYVENDNLESDNVGKGEQIAIVYATGGISSGKSKYSPNPLFGGQMVGSESFIEAMRTARESKSVKAVVLRIDSPGGDADASEAMWREVDLTRRTKPVIVSMAGLAASGGYFIAAAGDTIVAEPTTITGSIGVFSLHFSMEKFFRDKIGINTQLFETNPNADFFVRTSDAERAILARHIDTVYQHFMKVVADGRKLSIDSVNSIAQGRVWTGSQAKQVGLVDLLGGLDTAVSIAARRVGLKRGGFEIRVLPREKSWVEELSSLFQDRVANLFSRRSAVDEFRSTIEALRSRSGVQARMVEIKID